jgi:hypothetical protein
MRWSMALAEAGAQAHCHGEGLDDVLLPLVR